MLFYIIKDEEKLRECMDKVKQVYWPSRKLNNKELNMIVTSVKKEAREKKLRRRQTYSVLYDKLTEKMAKAARYEVVSPSSPGNGTEERLEIPFMERFHRHFVEREWEIPLDDKSVKKPDFYLLQNPLDSDAPREEYLLESLIKDNSRSEDRTNLSNFSQNSGNYWHFVNVIMATARLIMYFSSADNIRDIFEYPPIKSHELPIRDEGEEKLYQVLTYNKNPDKRSFMLMLGAFYHDIGKSVVDPQHGMEGGKILAFNTITPRKQLKDIANKYNIVQDEESRKMDFSREDYLFLIEVLNYHDQFGTLQTGEDGYLQLVSMVDKIKRYSLTFDGSRTNEIESSQQCLFDLWVLNLADIMVSGGFPYGDPNNKKMLNKFSEQVVWLDKDDAEEVIKAFFDTRNLKNLCHDIHIAFRFLKIFNEARHSDNTARISAQALECSHFHAMERIRRLIAASLLPVLGEKEKEIKEKGDCVILIEEGRETIEIPGKTEFIEHLRKVLDRQNMMSICRSIESIGNVQEFCRRLAWVGKMDYGLSFFKKIAERALNMIHCEEEILKHRCPGWFARLPEDVQKPDDAGDFPRSVENIKNDSDLSLDQKKEECEYIIHSQAHYFLSNYRATAIQILGYLLFRDEALNRLRNMEFSDMRDRMTDQKISKIIAAEGPFRSRRAIHLILQNIYLY